MSTPIKYYTNGLLVGDSVCTGQVMTDVPGGKKVTETFERVVFDTELADDAALALARKNEKEAKKATVAQDLQAEIDALDDFISTIS